MYIGLATVKMANGRKYLFRAPKFCSYLKEGDKVIVDTANGMQKGYITSTCSIDPSSEEFKMILDWSGASRNTLKKVVGKVVVNELSYEDEEDKGNGND